MTTRPQNPRRRSRHHLILAIFATVVGAIAGCATHSAAPSSPLTKPAQTNSTATSGQATGRSGSGGAAVCTLVSAVDVSTAFGEPMIQLGGVAADCIYAAYADHSQQLLVHEFLDQTNMNNLIQQLESSSEHVNGLGDDAFWNGTIDILFVRKGNIGFTITSASLGAKAPTDRDAPKAAMVALATTALSNL
jgi:hypothetical protein